MTLKYAIAGHKGRMGQAIQHVDSHFPNLTYIGPAFNDQYKLCTHTCSEADVIIDFSTPEGTQTLLKQVNKPLLIGTTGHTTSLSPTHAIAILYAPNTSPGIQLLKQAMTAMRTELNTADITIIETHHKHKRDKPSGTALSLKNTLDTLIAGATHVDIHAVRGGGATGEHEIRFIWEDEAITLTHRSFSRDVYARGALKLASWLAQQQPGNYSMENVFAGTTQHA